MESSEDEFPDSESDVSSSSDDDSEGTPNVDRGRYRLLLRPFVMNCSHSRALFFTYLRDGDGEGVRGAANRILLAEQRTGIRAKRVGTVEDERVEAEAAGKLQALAARSGLMHPPQPPRG